LEIRGSSVDHDDYDEDEDGSTFEEGTIETTAESVEERE
jgi:hypothetical protein